MEDLRIRRRRKREQKEQTVRGRQEDRQEGSNLRTSRKLKEHNLGGKRENQEGVKRGKTGQ